MPDHGGVNASGPKDVALIAADAFARIFLGGDAGLVADVCMDRIRLALNGHDIGYGSRDASRLVCDLLALPGTFFLREVIVQPDSSREGLFQVALAGRILPLAGLDDSSGTEFQVFASLYAFRFVSVDVVLPGTEVLPVDHFKGLQVSLLHQNPVGCQELSKAVDSVMGGLHFGALKDLSGAGCSWVFAGKSCDAYDTFVQHVAGLYADLESPESHPMHCVAASDGSQTVMQGMHLVRHAVLKADGSERESLPLSWRFVVDNESGLLVCAAFFPNPTLPVLNHHPYQLEPLEA